MEQLALVMAAGKGVRMLSKLPKPLHPICGMPMVEHVLRALDAVAADKALIVGYDREKLMQALHGQATFIRQDQTTGWGTGHALLSARDFLAGRTGQVIVTACDKPLVLPETYARLIEEVRRGAACAMLTDIVADPFGYSRVLRAGGRVCASLRHGALSGDQYMLKEVDASVYCFDIEKLVCALPEMQCADGEYHLSDMVGILSRAGHMVTTVPALEKCESLGVNDRVQLAQAEAAMRQRINTRHMRRGVTLIDPTRIAIQPDVTIGSDVTIYPDTTLEHGTTIDSDCVIFASRISGSHIGQGARVEHSIVTDATVLPGQKIGPFAVIGPFCRV
ncbi:MAG: NTP transferase domain-containing protein [Clostridia bacterium]